jgi:uncharacterized protein (TIGR03000 family)
MPDKGSAMIRVQVPPTATVFIEDQRTSQNGAMRVFQSPTLEPNKTYYYRVKVTWPLGTGQKDFVVEQEVTVRGGQTSIIDFMPLASLYVPNASTATAQGKADLPVKQATYTAPPAPPANPKQPKQSRPLFPFRPKSSGGSNP